MGIRISCRYALPLLLAWVTVAAFLGASGGDLAAQDEPRETTVCLGCHSGHDSTLAGTAHALLGDPKQTHARLACTDCHGTNRKHWEEGPAENPMVDPSKLGSAAEAKLCATCHQTAHQQSMLERNAHARQGVNCSGCHSVHAGDRRTTLLRKREPALCYDCHRGVQVDFARSFRHPVNDGVVRCSDCHQTLDETRRELSRNGTSACAGCHAEFQGPFPFEHPATLEHSTEEGGCLNCHAAHGSDVPRMLEQPYEPPHFQLCSQCHTVPGHNFNSMHGSTWAGVPCNTCHTDIHGSYTNRFFLSQAVEAEGCVRAGCHGR